MLVNKQNNHNEISDEIQVDTLEQVSLSQDRKGQTMAGGQTKNVEVEGAVERKGRDSGGGEDYQMETEREEEQRDCAKQKHHKRRQEPLAES